MCDDVKIELELVFHFDSTAGYGDRRDPEVRLPEPARTNVCSFAVSNLFRHLHCDRMGLAVEREVAGYSPSICACWGGSSGAEFDLGVLRTIEDSGVVHRLLYVSSLVWIQLRIEDLELAGVNSELDGARLLVYASGGERSGDLVLVTGKGKKSGFIYVNSDFRESSIDGNGLREGERAGK